MAVVPGSSFFSRPGTGGGRSASRSARRTRRWTRRGSGSARRSRSLSIAHVLTARRLLWNGSGSHGRRRVEPWLVRSASGGRVAPGCSGGPPFRERTLTTFASVPTVVRPTGREVFPLAATTNENLQDLGVDRAGACPRGGDSHARHPCQRTAGSPVGRHPDLGGARADVRGAIVCGGRARFEHREPTGLRRPGVPGHARPAPTGSDRLRPRSDHAGGCRRGAPVAHDVLSDRDDRRGPHLYGVVSTRWRPRSSSATTPAGAAPSS